MPPEIDVRNMSSQQVVSLFENADGLKVKGKGSAAKGCNGNKHAMGERLEWPCLCFANDSLEGSGASWKPVSQDADLQSSLQTKTNAQLLPVITALARGCALYATSPDTAHAGMTCDLLGRVFFVLGNKEAAIAVWESAPGCFAYWKGTQKDVCFGPAYRRLLASDRPVLIRMAERSCNTLHWRNTCEYLSSQGQKVDMNAVAQAENERRQDREDWEEQVHENLAKEEAEATRPSALLTALQSMPGANDPNAIVNAGNQQATAIQATGSANAAQQAAAVQQRVAAHQPAQIVASPRTLNSTNNSSVKAESSPTATNNAIADSGMESSSTAAHYAAPLPTNCIGEFLDPKYYNWLSFQNNCGQSVYVSWIATNLTDTFGFSAATLAPGAAVNSGWSQDEVQRKGGFLFEVCPAGYLPVDALTDQPVSRANQEFRCKQQ